MDLSRINPVYSVLLTPMPAFYSLFSKIMLVRIDRALGGCHEGVLDEKYKLLFKTKITIGDRELDIHTTSLPVGVTVHDNQKYKALGAIVWDNIFLLDNRRSGFEVDEWTVRVKQWRTL